MLGFAAHYDLILILAAIFLATHFECFTKEIDFASLKSISSSHNFKIPRNVFIFWTQNHLLSSKL